MLLLVIVFPLVKEAARLKTEYDVTCKDWTHYLDRKLVNERYEKRHPTIVTTNRGLPDWGEVFGDPVVASAILENWEGSLPKFHKVMPKDYKRALEEQAAEQEQQDQADHRAPLGQPALVAAGGEGRGRGDGREQDVFAVLRAVRAAQAHRFGDERVDGGIRRLARAVAHCSR